MGKRIKKLKKIRIHREGTNELTLSMMALGIIGALLWTYIDNKIPFWAFILVFGTVWMIALNFYRCPIRYFNGDSEKLVVAPADGKIVVVEDVDEHTYFHDKRLMISIFMSPWNVHANWFPVDGKVKFVKHFDGNYHKAWLPKASEENEHADIMIETPDGQEVLVRQIAGALARRIVTYAKEEEECYIDEHLGFIKLGSRVDVYLPVTAKPCVTMDQPTTGDQTVIAKLSDRNSKTGMKKHIPNTITCLNLISGCIATYWAFQGDYELALLFIVIGAVFDFFDGMVARLLHVSSPIGKELDSLADDITFGFAPSAIVFDFLCKFHTHLFFIPFLAFVMAAFSALRLAKFNLDERQALGFIGLPTPANALFWGSLIVGLGDQISTLPNAEYIILAGIFVSSWLLVAEIPMFALKFKTWGWKGNEIKFIFLLTCIPLLLLLGISGLAAIIAWYVILSVANSYLTK